MTLLALDAGNSNVGIGFFTKRELSATYTVSADGRRTEDEWFLLIDNLLELADLDPLDSIAMCSTVPSVLDTLTRCFAKHYPELPAWTVGPGIKTGIAIHTDNPREVGTDRIVNSLAAREIYGGPAIVVDLTGTATVFDAIDHAGNYVGGAIAPGVSASLDALAVRSAQLRSVQLSAPADVIGKNTTEAIQSGTIFGFAGLIDSIVARMTASLDAEPDEVCVIATGAHLHSIAPHCSSVTDVDENLTLKGLELVARKNA